jgi:hypothetical protein
MEYQSSLRRLSLLLTTIGTKTARLYSLVLSGNLVFDATRAISRWTNAFPNANILTSMPSFLNFLRQNPQFFSFLIFSSNSHKPADAHFLAYSTIPAIFQAGWCVEESVLWLQFLESYLEHMVTRCKSLTINSPHLKPFEAFFLQKLAFDFIQVSMVADVEALLFTSRAKECRLQFKKAGPYLVPDEYMDIVFTGALSIVDKLRSQMWRVPIVVRRLLATISRLSLRIPLPHTGVDLACFFFVSCVLVPVLKDPIIMGIDEDSCFVTDDLANLLLSSNCPSALIVPPIICAFFVSHNPSSLRITPMITELTKRCDATEFSTEFQELELIGSCAEYRKVAIFLPLDLYKVHKAAVAYGAHGGRFLTPGALVSFDYLLTAHPEIDNALIFDIFAVDLAMPLVPESDTEWEIDLPIRIRSCFLSVFSEVPASLFECADPSTVVGHYRLRPIGSAHRNGIDVILKNLCFLRQFLISEISTFQSSRASRVDLSIRGRLRFNELKILLQRVFLLNSTIFYSVNKLLIRVSIRAYLFQEISKYDDRIEGFVNDGRQDFVDFSSAVITALWAVLATRYPSPLSPARTQYEILLKNTFYCLLVDRVQIANFMRLDRVRKALQRAVIGEQWSALCARAAGFFRPAVLTAGTGLIASAMRDCPFTKMLNFALRAIGAIASVVPVDHSERTALIDGAVACCVANCGEGLLFVIVWGFFVDWFFPQGTHLLDIVGGLDARDWMSFDRLYRLLVGDP